MHAVANCEAASCDVKLWIGDRMANSRVDAAVAHKTGKAVDTCTHLYIDLGGSWRS